MRQVGVTEFERGGGGISQFSRCTKTLGKLYRP